MIISEQNKIKLTKIAKNKGTNIKTKLVGGLAIISMLVDLFFAFNSDSAAHSGLSTLTILIFCFYILTHLNSRLDAIQKLNEQEDT